MAGVVDVWVGELAKLGEKVKIQKCVFLKATRCERACESQVMQAEEEEQIGGKVQTVQVKAKKDNTFSESTVFMLMDSFAPS